MEDKKDRTPKHGSPIIPEPITGGSQAADLGQRPLLNWKKGHNRLATVLSVPWVLLTFVAYATNYQDDWLTYLIALPTGLFVLWAVIPFVVSIVSPSLIDVAKWVVEGFTDKPED